LRAAVRRKIVIMTREKTKIVEKESKERSGRVGRKYVGEQRDGRSPG